MRTLVTITIGLLTVLSPAQNPVPSYTNGTNPIPPYNGTNPPNSTPAPTITLPNSYPSSTGTNPIHPGSTSPTGSSTTYPTSPGVPQVNSIFPVLFQDPARTPRNPKRSDPVRTLDGSGGKYRGEHKVVPAKKNGFTTNRRTRGVKSKASRERSSQ